MRNNMIMLSRVPNQQDHFRRKLHKAWQLTVLWINKITELMPEYNTIGIIEHMGTVI